MQTNAKATTTYPYPSMLQTTLAEALVNPSSHTVPQTPLWYTSRRPSSALEPPTSRTEKYNKTSCARGDTICLHPYKLTISSFLFARWRLFRHVGYLRH